MSQIKFKFIIDLKDHSNDSGRNETGVVFNRFHPNNKKDRIQKKLNEDHIVSFWFEKRFVFKNLGEVFGEQIFYDFKSTLEDEKIISEQSHNNSELLFGELILKNITNEEYSAIKNKDKGNTNYIKIGKKVVQIIYEETHSFISIITNLFRQFWIKNLDKWDSKSMSLSTYSRNVLHLQYSLNYGRNWHIFEPDEHRHVIQLSSGIVGHKYK